jgi:hypothetical protein
VIRLMILRAIVIVSYPAAYLVFWLLGGVQWRRDVHTAMASMWRGERARV